MEMSLTRKAVKHFSKEFCLSVIKPVCKKSFADRLLKRQRLWLQWSGSGYLDTRFIVVTSNIFKRFFSVAVYAMGDRRKDQLPSNFELQLLLHINFAHLGIEDLHSVVLQ